jgi:hypothetical protein
MRRNSIMIIAGIIFAFATVAQADAFDPRDHKAAIAGSPSQVLVLGSPHLSGMPVSFRAELLEPLLDRLAAFKPR